MNQPREQIVADLLLDWEERTDQGISPEGFCSEQDIDDPEVIALFTRKVAALGQIDGLLSDTDSSSYSQPGLSEPTVRTENTLEVGNAIARGGRSSIHSANDKGLERQVALKTLLAPSNESEQRRLVQEAKILGSLQHPGVLPVYELSEDSQGQQFYTMPMIEGDSLNQAIQNTFQGEANAWNNDTIDLVRRFITVCQTVAYAHSRNIAHRDIKPDNIMLGSFGETFLVDWGLAKHIEDSDDRTGEFPQDDFANPQLTRVGSSLGTPAYMSPEQASGKSNIDLVANDIFNLGGTLYSILTGQAPYQGKPPDLILDDIQNCRFPIPVQINPKAPKPLQAICIRAMSRDPNQRFSSATEMVEELNRWFDDEPVRCHNESPFEKLARFNRRNGRWVIAGVAALVVLATTIAIAAIQINDQRKRADQNALAAWQSVNESIAEIQQNDYLKFSHIRTLRSQLLRQSLEKYERLLDDPHNKSTLGSELGNAYFQSALIHQDLGNAAKASEHYRLAANVFDEIVEDQPANQDVWTKSLRCWNRLAQIENESEKQEEAVSEFESRWQSAQKSFPESKALIQLKFESHLANAKRCFDSANVEEAVALLVESFDMLEQFFKEPTSTGHHNWARWQRLAGQHETNQEAKGLLLERAADRFEKVTAAEGLESDVTLSIALQYTEVLHQLAKHHLEADDSNAALSWYGQAKEFLRHMNNRYPTVPDFREQLQLVAVDLAGIHRLHQQYDRALAECELAQNLAFELDGNDSQANQLVAFALIELGQWHRTNGRIQESQTALLRAKQEYDASGLSIPGPTRRILGQNLLMIGADQWFVGDGQGALKSFEQAERLLNELGELTGEAADDTLHATSWIGVSLSHALLDDMDNAIQACQSAIIRFEAAGLSPEDGQFDMGLHSSHFLLAVALERNGDLEEAQQVRQLIAEMEPSTHQELVNLARAYALEGQMYGRGKDRFSENDLFFISKYATQSIDLLKRARESGLSDVSTIENDPAFATLFRLAEFRDLLAAE